MPGAPSQNQVAPSFDAFLRASQPLAFPLSAQTLSNFGDSRTFTADKTGYCESILVYVTGTFTSAAGTTGNFDPAFFPYNLINRITVQSNNGFQFYNTLGFENVLVQNAWYGKSNPSDLRISPLINALGTTPLYYTTQGARNVMPTVFNVTDSTLINPGSALGASKTYEFSIPYLIPLTTTQDIRTGLTLIQSQSSGLQIQMTAGSASDIANVTAGSLTLSSMTFTPVQYSYAVPNDASAQPYAPGQAIRSRWISERVTWGNSGDIDYRYPVGGTIVKSFHHFKNVSGSRLIPALFYATADRPSTANFGNVKMTYASTENPLNIPFQHQLWQYQSEWGKPLPDGVIPFDFGTLSYPDLGINPVGLLNTQGLTEAKVTINTSTSPSSGAVIDVLRQELQMSGGL